MKVVISLFVAFCFAIAFANITPQNDEIKKNLDEAKHIALKQELQANDKSNQGLLSSILGHLGTILKSLLSALSTGYLRIVAGLPEGLSGALKGLSKNGLIGLLGGLARSLNIVFRKGSATALINGLSGEQKKCKMLLIVCLFAYLNE